MLLLLLLTLFAIVYAQIGYPCLMGLLARVRPRPVRVELPPPDGVSIILCVHNGAAGIQQRLQNLLECQWEGTREILVFCDGCDDATAALAERLGHPDVRVLSTPSRRGKAAALNDAVRQARHSFVVFADLRQTFHPAALQNLALAFRDPAVGAVSGLLEIAPSASGAGRGVDLYWKIERKLREWEAAFDSVIGCTGAIYAIRRECYQDIPPDTILDDVVIPMQIAQIGLRILYTPKAIAYDPQQLSPDREKARKLRTLVGNYQMLERHPAWMFPWSGRLWWQFVSHKTARLAVPWLMVAAILFNLLAVKTPLVWALLIGQAGCYTLALTGCALPRLRNRLVSIPAGFLMLQWTCARALLAYARHRGNLLRLWSPPPDAAARSAC